MFLLHHLSCGEQQEKSSTAAIWKEILHSNNLNIHRAIIMVCRNWIMLNNTLNQLMWLASYLALSQKMGLGTRLLM